MPESVRKDVCQNDFACSTHDEICQLVSRYSLRPAKREKFTIKYGVIPSTASFFKILSLALNDGRQSCASRVVGQSFHLRPNDAVNERSFDAHAKLVARGNSCVNIQNNSSGVIVLDVTECYF